jgi:hypothetical protein
MAAGRMQKSAAQDDCGARCKVRGVTHARQIMFSPHSYRECGATVTAPWRDDRLRDLLAAWRRADNQVREKFLSQVGVPERRS